jgi:hypothetical protein
MKELINKRVRHKSLGSGIIADAKEKSIEVDFNGVLKKFIYPDAFKKFLVFEEDNLQEETDNLLEEKRKKAEEIRASEERERSLAERMQLMEKMRLDREKKAGRRSIKITNPAFKCTPCTGKSGGIGMCTICSKDGEPKNSVLRAGIDSHGKPKRMKSIEPNSLAVLTSVCPEFREEERMIFSVFLVDETFLGNEYREGFVKSSPKYRVDLTSREAFGMRFYDYYKPETSGSVKWGAVAVKSIDDKTAANILKAIAELKVGTESETAAKELYDYFYRTHKYTIED